MKNMHTRLAKLDGEKFPEKVQVEKEPGDKQNMVTGLHTSQDEDEENIKVTPVVQGGHKKQDGYDDHQSVKCNDDGSVTGDVPFHQIYSDTESKATLTKEGRSGTSMSSKAPNDIGNFKSQVMPLHQLQYSSYEHFKQLVYHPTLADTVCLEKATFIMTFILFKMQFPVLTEKKTWATIGPLDQLNDYTPIDFLENLYNFRHLLSQHIRRCQVNSMHITYRTIEYDSSNLPVASNDILPHLVEHKIGCGLFMATAMINHSCDPNGKVSKFNGKNLHLLSTKLIDPSREVTISYGLFYKYHSFNYRQSELSNNYYFKCQCKPCLEQSEPTFNAFKCTKCDGPVIEMDKVTGRNDSSFYDEPVVDDINAIKCQSKWKDGKNPLESRGEKQREENANVNDIKRKEEKANNKTAQTMGESSTMASENRTINLNNEKTEHKKVHFKEEQSKSESSNRIFGKKKVLTCVRCHCANHLNVKKLSNQLNQGNHLLSQGLQMIFEPEIADDRMIEAVGHLINAFEVLKNILYKSHMQITIVLEYICHCLKRLGRFREAIKFGKQLMAIVEEDYDEDVNLFNNQFKLLDVYRNALLQIRRKCETKGDSPTLDSATLVEEAMGLVKRF